MVPRRVVPASARSRSKSGTPSFRYRAGRRYVTGASSVRPARHSATRSSSAVPLTLIVTPPSTACQTAPNCTATISTLSETKSPSRDASSTSTARDSSGSCRQAGPMESIRKPSHCSFNSRLIDECSASSRASTVSATPPIRNPNAIADDAATVARRRQHTRVHTQAGNMEHAHARASSGTFSPRLAPIRRLRAGMQATAATPRSMQIAASPGCCSCQ